MSFKVRFLNVATLALQREDLRQRFVRAADAYHLPKTPGIASAYENTVVLAIFESAAALYSDLDDQVAYEFPYPGTPGVNPKRADLAYKPAGQGKNWAFIEVKYYSTHGIRADLEKLRSIQKRVQRWMFVYLVREDSARRMSLRKLIGRNFDDDLAVVGDRHFDTFVKQDVAGVCDLVLARIRR